MPEKKKITIPKTTETRAGRPQVTKAAKTRDASPGVAVAQPLDSQGQLQIFEAAMKLFHARRLQEALDLFRRAADGPELDVAQRARLHTTMCERRVEQGSLTLDSAEDYYNYGIALINTRRLPEARAHLEKALSMAPEADHIHYALALAQALSGDLAGAHEHLCRAIELDSRNRLIARQDADFAPLAAQPPFDALLYPGKKSW